MGEIKAMEEKYPLSLNLSLESLPGAYVNVGCAGVSCETPTTRQGIYVQGVKKQSTGEEIKEFFIYLTTAQMDKIVLDYLTWNIESQKEEVEKLLAFRAKIMAAPVLM